MMLRALFLPVALLAVTVPAAMSQTASQTSSHQWSIVVHGGAGVIERKDMPPATWNIQNAHEYGFYSNVNPEVDHPRWSQKTEHRLGGGFFTRPIPTQMFNGYADKVASLYAGMDLKKNY